jgi:hypothetical protein
LIKFSKNPKIAKNNKNPKIAKNNENPKNIFFNIFASFLAFSTSSQNNLNLKGLLNAFSF